LQRNLFFDKDPAYFPGMALREVEDVIHEKSIGNPPLDQRLRHLERLFPVSGGGFLGLQSTGRCNRCRKKNSPAWFGCFPFLRERSIWLNQVRSNPVQAGHSDPEYKDLVGSYAIPAAATIVVKEHQRVVPGLILAKLPRKEIRTKDITGGLPRVAELLRHVDRRMRRKSQN
jgi:hypothetical protein